MLVGTFMTAEPVTVAPETSLQQALHLMHQRRVGGQKVRIERYTIQGNTTGAELRRSPILRGKQLSSGRLRGNGQML